MDEHLRDGYSLNERARSLQILVKTNVMLLAVLKCDTITLTKTWKFGGEK